MPALSTKLTITKVFEFSAAHILFTVPPDHKCGRLHGHNWLVSLTLSGPLTNQNWIKDYTDLGVFKNWLDDHLDHRTLLPAALVEEFEDRFVLFEHNQKSYSLPLEDVALLNVGDTTAECLAIFFQQVASRLLDGQGVWVSSVEVKETPKTSAVCEVQYVE